MRRLRCISGALVAVLLHAPLYAQAPTGTIRGRVVDETSKQPLAGALVEFAGRRAVTMADGKYTITDAPAKTDSIKARLIGYGATGRQVTVAAGQTLTVDLAMAPEALSLGELVVVGYGQQRAGEITGAVSQVNAAEFNPGRNVSPAQLIQNKIPGVQVIDNNEPGGGLSIRIRGATSVNASNEPLYVIDGVPVGFGAGGGLSVGRDPLASLNPNEIESMTVLRDASAAAIYGANAANGVVLITTKKGKEGMRVEYSGNFSTSTIDRAPTMLGAADYRAAVQQFAPQNLNQLLNENTDWFGLVTQQAFGTDHNFSVSGADVNTNWRLSAGYLNQEGIVSGTQLERISLGVNFGQRMFNDRLEVNISLKGSRQDDQFTPDGVLSNAAQYGPTQPVNDPTSTTGFYEWPGNRLTSADNPMAILALATDRGLTYRSIGNGSMSYRMPFLEALQARVNFGYDVTRAERSTFNPSTLHSQTKTGTGGSDYRTNPTQTATTLEALLNYNAAVKAIPGTIDLTGGYSYMRSYGEFPWYLAQGLSTDLLGGNGTTAAKTVQNFQDVQEAKLISFFGRLNYNLNDKYLIGASLRRDGSSRFGDANAWALFPSVSGAWRISEEFGADKPMGLSDLKARASWAKTGNQAFANYQQYSSYFIGDAQSQVQFGNQFVSTIRPSAVDPNIKWEQTSAWNVGLDFGFSNQRLRGSIDWYTKDTDGILFNIPVAAGTNLSNFVTTNIGAMKNTGWEFMVGYDVIRTAKNGFTWTADFNASTNKNELTAINPNAAASSEILVGGIAGGVGTTIQVLRPGVPVNSFYVYQQKYKADGKPDEGKYEDLNGDGIINVADRRPYKDPAPDWIFGHSSYMTWGKWDAGFTLRAYIGNYVYNNVASNLGQYQELTRGSPYNLHTSVLETGFTSPQYLSDYYVEDASFLRMDNIQLGYTFQYRGQPLRVFGAMQNAFTLTGYSGVDPTAGLNGIDNNIYPRSRTFTAGLSLRL